MGLRRLRVPISRPVQQVTAVVATRDFLYRLSNPQLTPRLPGAVRGEARALLRHYPMAEVLRPVLEAGLQGDTPSDPPAGPPRERWGPRISSGPSSDP